MSVIRVGSTGKYADGWEQIFGGAGSSRGAKPGAKPKGKAKKAAKTTARKATTKKAKSRKR